MKYPLFIRVLRDTFADSTRKNISSEEIRDYCHKLSEMIQKNYTPDLVVAIGTGGSTPGKLIAEKLHVPIQHIIIRRNINIGRMYNKDPIPWRWIISVYHHFLFHTRKPAIYQKATLSLSGKKILLVDDSIHTGATIDVAGAYLKDALVSEIKTASLAYVSNRKPDFFILPSGNYCFPWSKDFVIKEN